MSNTSKLPANGQQINTGVKVLRVKYTGKTAEVEMQNERRDIETISSLHRPHQDFIDALSKLDKIFAVHMELDDERDRIKVLEVKRKETDKYSGFIMKGLLYCPGTNCEMKIESAFMIVPSYGFWDVENYETGDLLNLPEDNLWALQDEEVELFEKVLNEAYLYAKEGKIKVDQLDLFDSADVENDEAEESEDF